MKELNNLYFSQMTKFEKYLKTSFLLRIVLLIGLFSNLIFFNFVEINKGEYIYYNLFSFLIICLYIFYIFIFFVLRKSKVYNHQTFKFLKYKFTFYIIYIIYPLIYHNSFFIASYVMISLYFTIGKIIILTSLFSI